MRVSTSWTTDPSADALSKAYEQLKADLGASPHLLLVYFSATGDTAKHLGIIRKRDPGVLVQGCTSCLGAMTQGGFHSHNGFGTALMGIFDPEGSYGIGSAILGDNPTLNGRQAVRTALANANRPGEVPAIVWMTAAPGHEESLIAGIAAEVGKTVPIAGGSSGDNDVSGKWCQVANDEIFTDAVVVSVFFPSREIIFGFHSGYEPTEKKGHVTKASGRVLEEIDHRPAAQVYDEWTSGIISDLVSTGGNILSRTSLNPLGRIAGHVSDVPYYQLSHPNAVTSSQGLTLFSEIGTGEEITLMHGTVDTLIPRAGRVVLSVLETHSVTSRDVAGVLIVFCAGCMLTVQNHMPEVVGGLGAALPGVPFLGGFTFGEQGCFVGGENRHGNLMISVLLFLK